MAKTAATYDVTKHILVPKHTKVSEKETAEVLKEYSITARELPKILITDPAIAHLDVAEGDVIKIVRENPHAGQVLFYRRVTRG